MKIIFLLLFLPGILFCQDAKVRVLSEEKRPDSIIVTIAELTVQNNSLDPLCISISTRFLIKNLSKDTIELATFGNDTYAAYDLLYTKEDVDWISDYKHEYPLVINGLTSFVVTLKLTRKSSCKEQLFDLSYLKATREMYDLLLAATMKREDWDPAIKLKFIQKSISFGK